MSNPRGGFEALLFDLDGTLVDSMPLHQRAWVRWFASIGQPLDEDPGFFASSAGRSNTEILADMYPQKAAAELEAMADAKEALYRADACLKAKSEISCVGPINRYSPRGRGDTSMAVSSKAAEYVVLLDFLGTIRNNSRMCRSFNSPS